MKARAGDPDFPYMMENTPEEFDRVVGRARRYDEGGYLPGGLVSMRNDTGKPELVLAPIQLSRGSVVMSRASLDALDPDMRERLFGDADVISAEDALAELAEDDDEG